MGMVAAEAAYRHGEPWLVALLDYLRANPAHFAAAVNGTGLVRQGPEIRGGRSGLHAGETWFPPRDRGSGDQPAEGSLVTGLPHGSDDKGEKMRINDDFSRQVTVQAGQMDWVASPAKGVDRKMLYRVGDEVARATSIVRYAPGSAFPAHAHTGGEEILVLEGTFQDEHGDYPAGCYFRNPPGTAHSPAAKDGCVIFVRLWQYRKGDTAQIVRQPGQGDAAPLRPGAVSAQTLFDDGAERVALEDWQPGADVQIANPRGLEMLVLSGNVTVDGQALGAQGWHRRPAGMPLEARIGVAGARVWIKDAPLQHADVLQMPQ